MRNWSGREILNPRGMWTLQSGVRKGNPSRASLANNVRISPGVAESRPGTSPVLSVTAKITGLYNWLPPIFDNLNYNIVLYQEGTAIKRYRFSDGRTDALVASVSGARAPSFADLASRIYMCAYGTDGYGRISCQIHDGDYTNGTPNVDTAFRGPLTLSAATASDGGAGRCTAGTHYLGIVFQSRSGFSGQPTTTVSASPISITLGSDLRTISLSVTFDSPSDAGPGSFVYPIITRADNPDKWYFVPGASMTPPYNFPGSTLTFAISVSDEDLAASAESADAQFNLLIDGAGAPLPGFVVAYGRRMCYGAGTKLYVSDINDPQSIAEDLNVVQLPSKRQIGFAFPLSGGTGLFLTGDKWTGRTVDNGDSPATWEQPTMISDAIGAVFPGCVEYKTAGAYAWVAAEAGLYLFNGTFPTRTITYLVSDQWARINWGAAYAIQVKDDVANLKCYVAAPLDGATEPSHVFVVDYTNGLAYDTCDITLDNFNTATFSSIGIVKEISTSRTNLWIGPSGAGNVVHYDSTTHNDSGNAIHCLWESGLIRQPGELQSKTIRVGGADLWIRGAGALIQTWYGLDRVASVTPQLLTSGGVPATLSTAPGLEYSAKFDLSPVENATLRLETNAVNEWFRLSGFKPDFKPALYTR